ncbi:MAG: hypothetical protein LBM94_04900 [Propionibacteriaceae bacterium]|nr:hypothetical protein [Propionibacteriaceae bacterium]
MRRKWIACLLLPLVVSFAGCEEAPGASESTAVSTPVAAPSSFCPTAPATPGVLGGVACEVPTQP